MSQLKPQDMGKGLLMTLQGHGNPHPKQIRAASKAASVVAAEIGGFAGTNVEELMGTPLTAHFLGGCPIGELPGRGVIDPYHRLYGHPGICVADGAAVSANAQTPGSPLEGFRRRQCRSWMPAVPPKE